MSKRPPKDVPVNLRATRQEADDIDEYADRAWLSRSAAWRYLAMKGLDAERRASTTVIETTAA